MTMIRDVYQKTGITATGGIGTNLYLSKVAMDIVAKALMPDPYGVRIAFLDETAYRRTLWGHQPLTDFGVLAPVRPGVFLLMAFTPWGILPASVFPMPPFCMIGLASMPSCSLIMPGVGIMPYERHQAIYPQSLQPRHKSGPAQALFTGKCPPDCMGDDG